MAKEGGMGIQRNTWPGGSESLRSYNEHVSPRCQRMKKDTIKEKELRIMQGKVHGGCASVKIGWTGWEKGQITSTDSQGSIK